MLRLLPLEAEPGTRKPRERAADTGARTRRRAGPALAPLQQRDKAVVLEVPGRGDDDVPGRVRRAVIARERAAAHRGDHRGRADHRPPERVVGEDGLREEVVHELLRGVLVHRDLLEHDLPLLVDLREGGREDHVGDHLERLLDVVVGDPRVDDGVLARGGGVQLGAHRVEGLRDLLRVEPP